MQCLSLEHWQLSFQGRIHGTIGCIYCIRSVETTNQVTLTPLLFHAIDILSLNLWYLPKECLLFGFGRPKELSDLKFFSHYKWAETNLCEQIACVIYTFIHFKCIINWTLYSNNFFTLPAARSISSAISSLKRAMFLHSESMLSSSGIAGKLWIICLAILTENNNICEYINSL